MVRSLTEKRLSHTPVFKGRVFSLATDEVELPNGKMSSRDVIEHPGAVAIVPVDADGRLILIEQFRYAIGKVLLEIPAGTLKPHESPDHCVERELQEEIGYKPGHVRKLGAIYVAPGYSSELIHLYLASDLTESRLDMDEDEFIEVKRLSLTEVQRLIQTGAIQDAKTVSAVMLALPYLAHLTS